MLGSGPLRPGLNPNSPHNLEERLHGAGGDSCSRSHNGGGGRSIEQSCIFLIEKRKRELILFGTYAPVKRLWFALAKQLRRLSGHALRV